MASLFSWGANKYGQCGFGTTEDQSWPKKINSADFACKYVAVGPRFCIALSASGDLWSWGQGLMGELGLAYATEASEPTKITKIPEGTKFKAIAVGSEHAVAITEQGTLVSWGGNDLGQLGHGTVKPADRPFPVKVPDPKEKFVAVACGWKHSCAVTEGGIIYCWGAGHAGQLGDGETLNISTPKKIDMENVSWRDVKCAENSTFALTTRGKIYSWGAGGHGRLGHGDGKNQSKPKLIEALSKMEHKFADISVGYDHTIAITDKGILFAWGAGAKGQLGLPTCNRQLAPKMIAISEKYPFKSISVGYEFTAGVTVDGDLYAWGNNENGRVGNGLLEGFQPEPKKLDCDLMLNAVFCGHSHSVAIGSGMDRPPAGWEPPAAPAAEENAPSTEEENAGDKPSAAETTETTEN